MGLSLEEIGLVFVQIHADAVLASCFWVGVHRKSSFSADVVMIGFSFFKVPKPDNSTLAYFVQRTYT